MARSESRVGGRRITNEDRVGPGPRLEIVSCGVRSRNAAADVADATTAAARSAPATADTGNGAASAAGSAATGRSARNAAATAAGSAATRRTTGNAAASAAGSAGATGSRCSAGLGFRGRRTAGRNGAGHRCRRCRRRRRGGAAARSLVVSAATGDGHDEHGPTAEGREGSSSSSSHQPYQSPLSSCVLQGCLGRIPPNLRGETDRDPKRRRTAGLRVRLPPAPPAIDDPIDRKT